MAVNTSIPGTWERWDPPRPPNPDPFNWAKIAADLKAEEQRKTAAKKRTKAPVKTKAAPKLKAAPQAAAPAPAPLTVKETLDAFRAANNGALPPGTTPEMAAMIDQGIWSDWSQLTANPALAQSLLAIQHQIISDPAAYDAAKAQVASQYQNLTGDVLTSGKQWMQDLFGRIVDPNDPNSALVKNDPALAAYGQSMSQIQETSDANQATDLAWFDKMKQNALTTNQGLLAAIAAQGAIPAGGGSGGGGGGRGGRGRRGGRGYGGGGSGGGGTTWKTPTNTLTNLQSAAETATETANEYNVDFYDALMASTADDPDLQALAKSVWNVTDMSARGVTQEVQKRKNEAQQQLDQMTLQQGLHEDWLRASPGHVATAIGKLTANKPGAVLGDDPTTINKTEQYYIPEEYRKAHVGEVTDLSDEQKVQNQLAEELLAAKSKVPAFNIFNKIFKKKNVGLPYGVASPEAILEQKTKGAVSPEQLKILARYGTEALAKLPKNPIPGEPPIDLQSWAQSGGYIEPINTVKKKEDEKNLNYYDFILDQALGFNPNASLVTTNRKVVNQGKDSSTYQTKNTNKGFTNALTGSPLDLTPAIPEAGIASNPVSNPQGFDIFTDSSENETANYSPVTAFGLSKPMKIDKNIKSLIDKRAAEIMSSARAQPSIHDIFHGATIGVGKGKQPVRPKVNTAIPGTWVRSDKASQAPVPAHAISGQPFYRQRIGTAPDFFAQSAAKVFGNLMGKKKPAPASKKSSASNRPGRFGPR